MGAICYNMEKWYMSSSVWGMRVSKCGIKERANLLVCFMKMGEIIIYKIRSGFLSLVFWRIRNSKQ